MENLTIKKLVLIRRFFIAMTLIGSALLTYMITVESEPGLLPLLLVIIGITSTIYFHIKLKNRSN
jgi:hypothetical protein